MNPFIFVKRTKNNLILNLVTLFLLYAGFFNYVYAQEGVVQDKNTQIPIIETANAGFVTKVAPGEFLPISVKILNFGGTNRVDATITYQIFNSYGEEVYISTETVAIETTASFVKIAQVPFNSPEGIYTAKASVEYGSQTIPAITQFPFTVEKKIFGLFKSDFYKYNIIFIPVSIFMIWLGYITVRRKKLSRIEPFDYGNVVPDQRIYFEIISDTIMGMRQRVGDEALSIAKDIPGLTINQENGRVLELTDKPSKIIAVLVSRYESILGKKVSFSFRR